VTKPGDESFYLLPLLNDVNLFSQTGLLKPQALVSFCQSRGLLEFGESELDFYLRNRNLLPLICVPREWNSYRNTGGTWIEERSNLADASMTTFLAQGTKQSMTTYWDYDANGKNLLSSTLYISWKRYTA
jgi:hypothetical protein